MLSHENEAEEMIVAKPRGILRRRLTMAAFGLAALVSAAALTLWRFERSGRSFVATGVAVLETLGSLAEAAEARDAAAIESLYGEAYEGRPLGLTGRRLVHERDGVRIYRFDAGAGAVDRPAAVDEWRRYLAGFERIDEVELHVHRLEDWRGHEITATLRFELVGTPLGESRPAVDRATFRMSFERSQELRIRRASLVAGERVTGERPHFANVAEAAGIAFENRFYPAFLTEPLKFPMLRFGPAGISAVDYDNDGYYDLFIPDGVESKLFENRRDGTFAEVTREAGLAGLSGVSVGVFADYDNDGFKDLFVSRTFEPNQLFHNDGDGTFTDVTAGSGIGADCCTTVASWADYDGDGLLDLYLGRYIDPRARIPTTFYARNGEPNQLYKNDGADADGRVTFTNVTEEAGVGEIGLCLGSVFGDYDDDGDPDLYVVNDFGRNTLYRNDGGRFEDVTLESGTLAYGAGMNASFGDYDNDGRLDIYVTNIRSDYAWYAEAPTIRRYMASSFTQGVWRQDLPLFMEIFRQSGADFVGVFRQMGSGNTLLENRGDGTFEDVTWAAGANPPGWFWGAALADFDNDGWQDVYAADGWIYNEPDTEIELDFFEGVTSEQQRYKKGDFFDPRNFEGKSWHGWERNRHLLSRGPGDDGRVGFTEIGLAAGTALLTNSRGVAVADFWNRGVLDIAVAASTDRHALLRNEVGLARDWLAVEVQGGAHRLADGTNRDGVGVRVTVRAGGRRQMREVALGDGYGSQSSLRLYFGLGEAARVDEMTVLWPRSGRLERFADVPVNRIVAVAEGEGRWREIDDRRRP